MLFSFSRYLNSCLEVLVVYKNGLIRDKVNFEMYDVTTWLTNNCNTHCPISQEVKATRR